MLENIEMYIILFSTRRTLSTQTPGKSEDHAHFPQPNDFCQYFFTQYFEMHTNRLETRGFAYPCI